VTEEGEVRKVEGKEDKRDTNQNYCQYFVAVLCVQSGKFAVISMI